MTELSLSPDQAEVAEQIEQWYYRCRDMGITPERQCLTVGGYAGTGKTTLIAHIIGQWKARVAVAALAGKAAQVLRSKGIPASTIHSLIYDAEQMPDGTYRFYRKPTIDADVVVIDEASMINHELLRDLRWYCKPILFVGDHGQLEPIGDNPNLMASPQLRLEKIHRQAADNPILQCAHYFREGFAVPFADDTKNRLSVRRRQEFWKSINPEAQIICGFNATRHKINQIVRKQLGMTGQVCPGERIICLRNVRELGIFNGQQFTVNKVMMKSARSFDLTVNDGDKDFQITALREQFGRDTITTHQDRSTALFDYAYAITCHKSQGSEYESVLVLDEVAGKWNPKRWRYTAATRARSKLIYCM